MNQTETGFKYLHPTEFSKKYPHVTVADAYGNPANLPGYNGKEFSILLDKKAFAPNDIIISDRFGMYYQVQKSKFFWLKRFLVWMGWMNPFKLMETPLKQLKK